MGNSSRAGLLTPPQATRTPWSAPYRVIALCNVRITADPTAPGSDFTSTTTVGDPKPNGPVPARISTPPSGPAGEMSQTKPRPSRIAAISRVSSCSRKFVMMWERTVSLIASRVGVAGGSSTRSASSASESAGPPFGVSVRDGPGSVPPAAIVSRRRAASFRDGLKTVSAELTIAKRSPSSADLGTVSCSHGTVVAPARRLIGVVGIVASAASECDLARLGLEWKQDQVAMLHRLVCH